MVVFTKRGTMDIAVILAAGNSSRFSGSPKQLYKLDGKPMVAHSVDVFRELVDEVIVVTNGTCHRQMKKLFGGIAVVKNNIDTRIASIKAGLDHIERARNVILHDAARPFVTKNHICKLLSSSEDFLCSQYYFPLVNGLVKRTETGLEVVPREHHMELVTPQIIDYRLARDLYSGYIDSSNPEVLPLLDKLKIRYNLIEGHWDLRKITTLEDLE